MECVWQVESDDYCNRVLEKHWPGVKRYGDIKEIDWSEVERPDLICGGFPCQPVSVAGKQLAQEDERWLWPEFRRCLRGVRPRYVLVENVPGLLTGGMGDVLGDLAALGYDAEWESLPAAAFGAPHLRYRVFVVAYRTRDAKGWTGEESGSERERTRQGSESSHVADAPHDGRSRSRAATEQEESATDQHGEEIRHPEILTLGAGLRETESRGIRGVRLGDSDWWESEPTLGVLADGLSVDLGMADLGERPIRVAKGVPRRVDQLRALGNAVVPQVAEWIGKRIMEGDG